MSAPAESIARTSPPVTPAESRNPMNENDNPTEQAPEQAPYLPGRQTFQISVAGIAKDLVGRLIEEQGPLGIAFHQGEDGQLYYMAKLEDVPWAERQLPREVERIRSEMAFYTWMEERFPCSLHERARRMVETAVRNLATGLPRENKRDLALLDLEVTAEGYSCWIRSECPSVLRMAAGDRSRFPGASQYDYLKLYIRSTVSAAIRSAFTPSPF